MNTDTNEMNMKELNLDEMEQTSGGYYICSCVRFIKCVKRCLEKLLDNDD